MSDSIASTSPPNKQDPRRILAMGGGGFTMGERASALDRLVLDLTGKPVPKVCFLPTASGDPREQLIGFHERFSGWPCQPTTLSLFHLGRDRTDPARHLLEQDAIYVGGGSMRNMLAIWREHGLDKIMRSAWNAGIVLAGLSAGAMCWFQGGISMSGGRPQIVRGIGLLPGSFSVHRTSEPERLPAYLHAVASRRLAVGHAADDGTALVYAGQRLVDCVTTAPNYGISEITVKQQRVVQNGVSVRLLPGSRQVRGSVSAEIDEAERMALAEFRTLHAGSRRLD